jgi:hypothetical protein
MSGITSPIANRLKNAPSKAVFLSGNDIGSIKPTSIAPKIRPLTRPDKRGDMARRIKKSVAISVKRIQIRTLPKIDGAVITLVDLEGRKDSYAGKTPRRPK